MNSSEEQSGYPQIWQKLYSTTTTEFYDCTFEVGPKGKSKTFHGLKILLANLSDVFKAQLFGKFQESKHDRDTPILLPKSDADVFECILRASYGLKPKINGSNVMGLILEAKYYEIGMLVDECVDWLSTNLNADNALAVLDSCYTLGLINIDGLFCLKMESESNEKKTQADNIKHEKNYESLALSCLGLIFSDSEKIIESDFFSQKLNINVLKVIISSDLFFVNEEILWQKLVKWCQNQAQNCENETIFEASLETNDDMKSLEIDNNGNKNVNSGCNYCQSKDNSIATTLEFGLIQQLLKYVRFTRMSKLFFCKNVTNWLTRNDLEYIFMRLCCFDEFKTKDDWIDYNERIKLDTQFNCECRVVSASNEFDKAQKICTKDVNANWSGVSLSSDQTQWFIVEMVGLRSPLMSKLIKQIEIRWTNQYGDSDTIKDVTISACSMPLIKEISALDCEPNESQWKLVMNWQSEQTSSEQKFDLDLSNARSPFIKFEITSTYGGYTCLDDLQVIAKQIVT